MRDASKKIQVPAGTLGLLMTGLFWSCAASAVIPDAGEADAVVNTSAFASYRPAGSASDIQSFDQDTSDMWSQPIGSGASAATVSETDLQGSPGTKTLSTGISWARGGAAGVHASVRSFSSADYLNSGHGTTEVSASWWDGVVITSPGISNGTSGYIKASLLLDGAIAVNTDLQTANNYSSAFATFSIQGEGLPTFSVAPDVQGQCKNGAGYCSYGFAGSRNFGGGPANGVYEFGALDLTIPFKFGEVFYVGFSLSAKATAQAISWNEDSVATFAEGLASFAHTVRWGGVSGVYRQSGSVVSNYAMESGSGVDYRIAAVSAVPAPPAAALMLAGLLVVGAYRRTSRVR